MRGCLSLAEPEGRCNPEPGGSPTEAGEQAEQMHVRGALEDLFWLFLLSQ